ncbi:MAG: sulfite exporter TauE/SafE family protein, partial [Chthoniobacterales bacterium]|nr:sulfite exporter TauE/SafE family protein [Chthoniobacterales bacterium]
MTTTQFLLGLGVGAVTGVLAALCGVGGGLIMVPAFVFFFALDQKSAVATSLAVIIAVSLVATTKYASGSMVKWQVVLPVMIGAVATTWVAADWLKLLSNDLLTRAFAILMIAASV